MFVLHELPGTQGLSCVWARGVPQERESVEHGVERGGGWGKTAVEHDVPLTETVTKKKK